MIRWRLKAKTNTPVFVAQTGVKVDYNSNFCLVLMLS